MLKNSKVPSNQLQYRLLISQNHIKIDRFHWDLLLFNQPLNLPKNNKRKLRHNLPLFKGNHILIEIGCQVSNKNSLRKRFLQRRNNKSNSLKRNPFQGLQEDTGPIRFNKLLRKLNKRKSSPLQNLQEGMVPIKFNKLLKKLNKRKSGLFQGLQEGTGLIRFNKLLKELKKSKSSQLQNHQEDTGQGFSKM